MSLGVVVPLIVELSLREPRPDFVKPVNGERFFLLFSTFLLFENVWVPFLPIKLKMAIFYLKNTRLSIWPSLTPEESHDFDLKNDPNPHKYSKQVFTTFSVEKSKKWPFLTSKTCIWPSKWRFLAQKSGFLPPEWPKMTTDDPKNGFLWPQAVFQSVFERKMSSEML